MVDRSAFVAAGKYGLIGFNMPEEFGGGGSDDFRFNAVIDEELARYGGSAPSLSSRMTSSHRISAILRERRAEGTVDAGHRQR